MQATPGVGTITLSWDNVPGATSYNIYWSNTSGDGTSGTKITNVISPYTHENLTPGSDYYYVVTSVNGSGESIPSVEVSSIPFNPGNPDNLLAPSNVQATPGAGTITLSWDTVSGATFYNIYWSNTSGDGTSGTKITNVISPYTHENLTYGSDYYYVVTAADASGESDPSNEVSATPDLAAPANVQATPGPGTITLSWDTVPGATSYNIYWSNTSGDGISGTKIVNATSPYTHENLTPGTDYYYVVTAENVSEESVPSVEVSSSPENPGLASPANVQATPGPGTITLSWDTVPGATSYNIYWSNTSGDGTSGTKVTNVTSPYVHEKLVYGSYYYYVVTAEDASGESAPSVEVSGTPGRLLISDITFGDSKFKFCIDSYSKNYADEITGISCSNKGITSISGIEWFTNLSVAVLDRNNISDVSPLAGLTKLTNLNLELNNISDISALEKLINIKYLYLQVNNITDISPIAGMTQMTQLSLNGNNASNLNVISGMTQMVYLYLSHCGIVDISPLAGFTKLQTLSLESNYISDISALSGLTALSYLNVRLNSITDISPLSGNASLTTLYAGNNSINDLSSLSDLPNLKVLSLPSNGITGIGSLSSFTSLTNLDLSGNQIVDISSLSSLSHLTHLYSSGNSITDVSPLEGMTTLTNLDLSGNQIADFSPLLSLTSLTQLYLGSTGMTDVSSFASLTGLKDFQVGYNPLTTGVADLVTLTNATMISLIKDTSVPCADITTLVNALGPNIVFEPLSCAP